MRGAFTDQGQLFSYISPEARVGTDHPLRKIRKLVRDVLVELNRSLSRLYVGEITATAVFGQNEYAISARARAGGVLKALLVDGEASFSTHGTIKGDYPVPMTFASKMSSRTPLARM
jgi:hypothetical protein